MCEQFELALLQKLAYERLGKALELSVEEYSKLIAGRNMNPVGVVVDFYQDERLSVDLKFESPSGNVSAILNDEVKIEAMMYIDNNFITAMEYYSIDGVIPNRIDKYNIIAYH